MYGIRNICIAKCPKVLSRFLTLLESASFGSCLMNLFAPVRMQSNFSTSSGPDSSPPSGASIPKKLDTSVKFCAYVKCLPWETTGIDSAPRLFSSLQASGCFWTSIDSKTISRIDKNSFVLKQLVQPGRQKTFILSVIIPTISYKPIQKSNY